MARRARLEAEGRARHSFSSLMRRKRVKELMERACKEEGVSLPEVKMGSRRGGIPKVRRHLALKIETTRPEWKPVPPNLEIIASLLPMP